HARASSAVDSLAAADSRVAAAGLAGCRDLESERRTVAVGLDGLSHRRRRRRRARGCNASQMGVHVLARAGLCSGRLFAGFGVLDGALGVEFGILGIGAWRAPS